MADYLAGKFSSLVDQPQLGFLKTMAVELPTAEWFLVGGAVRDVILGRFDDQQHDFDLVVRGVDLDEVSAVLSRLGRVNYVGRDFGVLKFWPEGSWVEARSIDIAWPRIEQAGRSGGRRDFIVHSDPDLPMVDDLSRRDFTVNALAWDFNQAQLIDPFGGLADIEAGLIRAVGQADQRFQEDYSRLLRAVRFACELDFEIAEETWAAVARLADHLNDTRPAEDGRIERIVSYEIIASEFLKMLSANAVRAVDLLERSEILFKLLPELGRLIGLSQPSKWHSEGDVWQHTKLALQKLTDPDFIVLFPEEQPTLETKLAVLLHDIGKADTFNQSEGRITFHGHDVRGAELARSITERLKLSSVPRLNIRPERIEWLVQAHLFPILVDLDHVRKTTLSRYFLTNEEAGRQLLHLGFADLAASIPESGQPDISNLERLLIELDEVKLKQAETPAWLTGDEVLMATGLEPGPKIGRLLEELHEAQLSGEVETEDQAKEFLWKKIRDWETD
ncbi:HDIG domain-containing protein [Patescibacteria group bacterium]|nr:HDIG domain-containing protein [Patescibacteria group bacterium]MBU1916455.1 HDIG domain-containing protein [Patescibacteria group bacterium]